MKLTRRTTLATLGAALAIPATRSSATVPNVTLNSGSLRL